MTSGYLIEFWFIAAIATVFAGIVERKAFEDITPEAWDRMIRIHLTGTYNWVHAVIPYMKKQNGGKIGAFGKTGRTAGNIVFMFIAGI